MLGSLNRRQKEQGFEVKWGNSHSWRSEKHFVYGESDGFVKIIADQKTDDILGIHMIGPRVTDMISEAGLAKST
ncbi:hypothetical protein ACEQPO_18570 [Bacillus sp. SL00103]